MPKISVIIPVYNVEPYIRKSVLSVVNQTLKDIEIIIVNDGTKDNSMSVCEDIISKDKRIRVVNKENGGLMSAWLAGLDIAESKYVGFVDSDDWVDLDFFENLYEEMESSQADIVVGQYILESMPPKQLYRSKNMTYCGKEEIHELTKKYFRAFLCEDNPISYCRWDKLYKKSILEKNRTFLNTKVSLGEDVNTNAAVLPDCQKVVVLNDTAKYHYRINEESISNKYNENEIYRIKELYNTLLTIIKHKAIDFEDIMVFIGNMYFEEINKVIMRIKCKRKEKRKMIKKILEVVPENALKIYARARGDFFVCLYCFLLDVRCVDMAIWMRKCHR